MELSIILPAYNEEKLLPATLAGLRQAVVALDGAGVSHEIIVCNNNSTDRTAEIAEAAGARVVFEPENKIGLARNRGASVATGTWLLFIDADSVPDAAILADLVQAIRAPACVGGGSTLRTTNAKFYYAAVLQFWNVISRITRCAAGSFLYARREAFEAVGGFGTEFYAGEELDLSQKLKAWGRQNGLPGFRILHRHPLLTSARKADLYSLWDHLQMVWKGFLTVIKGKKGFTAAEDCKIWYDGRR
jgi:cellulose synthase/poly-beta-1,6-N-acetylglucosamine synthase-like glycosyltransferase